MERAVQQREEQWLGPVAMAQFIDSGWILEFPFVWTRRRLVAVRRGFGRERLPFETGPGQYGLLWWLPRVHRAPKMFRTVHG